jgi:hypothetical protein
MGVVITLIYLARQIHQNSETSRTEGLNRALDVHVGQIAEMTATDEAAELFRRFCVDFQGLSLNDRGRVHAMMLNRIASFNQVQRLHATGMLDDDEFHAMRGTFVSILRSPGGRAWWDRTKFMMPKNLEAKISAAIENPNIKRRSITEEQRWLFE